MHGSFGHRVHVEAPLPTSDPGSAGGTEKVQSRHMHLA